jgi:prevent-host-death family protein
MSAPGPIKLSGPIPAAQFKANCLELMDYVQDKNAELIITKHGKPVAKLVPCSSVPVDLCGYLKGSVTELSDLIEPTGEPWEADAD